MKNRISAAVLEFIIMLTSVIAASCNYKEPIKPVDGVEQYKPENIEPIEPAVVESTVGITLFSWQIPTAEYAEKYCTEIKN